MTLDEVITLIQTWIIENGNEEITADVLRPILEAMVNQPNDLIGDLSELTTTDKENLVEAINEVKGIADLSNGLKIYYGAVKPNDTPPIGFHIGDFYAQTSGLTVITFWQHNGIEWIEIKPLKIKTVFRFVSLVGIETAGKSQIQWMIEAINANILDGRVFSCNVGEIMTFYVNIIDDISLNTLRRIYFRLSSGATSVTSLIPNSINPDEIMPDGEDTIVIPSEFIVNLADIGSDDVWDAFNADDNQPFDMTDEMFVQGIQNDVPKLWQWLGGEGSFGSGATPAVEEDFLDLTEQPETITTNQNNIVVVKNVLDTDLGTLDGEGLADYFNELSPPILKQGWESWRIHIVDSGDSILKKFDLVDRGKGFIGTPSELSDLIADNFDEIDYGSTKPLVTADTSTIIQLYPFGNFCNSYIANLEETEFTFLLTDEDEPAGETATVLIKTDSGASDFPTLADAEYVEGAAFEADAYFDLYAWHNGAIVAYTFLKRSAPIVDPLAPYIFKVDTSITGITGSTSIRLPIASGFGTTHIDWGDGFGYIEYDGTTAPIKDYGVAGIYTIKILGVTTWSWRAYSFQAEGAKVISLDQWGKSEWISILQMFYQSYNVVINATDTPNTSSVTEFRQVFYQASLVDFDLSDWDVRNGETFLDMFKDVTLSTVNYDKLLISWAAQSVESGMSFNAGNSQYTSGGAAEAARLVLTGTYGWTITDGGIA